MTHEDPIPTARPRDVIDELHAAEMARKARAYRLSIRYNVHHGYQGSKTQPFTSFVEALAFFVALWDPTLPMWEEPALVGLGADDVSDGLTEMERAVLAMAKGEE